MAGVQSSLLPTLRAFRREASRKEPHFYSLLLDLSESVGFDESAVILLLRRRRRCLSLSLLCLWLIQMD